MINMELSFEEILRLSQKELKSTLFNILQSKGYSPISEDGFLYAKGDIPIMLIAHLDTVHKAPVTHICYSKDGNIMMSPSGIGGDDRCGVYMIMEIIKNHRPYILFTEDEEIGCIGARKFAKSNITPSLKYMIELDRRGSNDAVFYRCNNRGFTDFICSFGFTEESGSFSDISVIAPKIGAAAVNISAGYYFEHTKHEYIDLADVKNNISRINNILSSESDYFEYIEYKEQSMQMSLENSNLWCFEDVIFEPAMEKYLMPIPKEVSILLNGYRLKQNSDYYLDDKGNIYKYLPELRAAILSEFSEICKEDKKHIVFHRGKCKKIRITTFEYASQKLEA